MTNPQNKPQDEQLAKFVDSLLNGEHPEFSPEQETATLQALTSKIIEQNRTYPGAPKIDSQKRLALLTEYRRVYGAEKNKQPAKKRFGFSGGRAFQLSAAAGVFLLAVIAIFIGRQIGFPTTPASAGGDDLFLPVAAAGVALLVIAVIWFASKRR
ncbi:hypothetical protein KQH54_00145 [bacterium]|nr:hypothetical protein [bacterium]